MRTFVFLTACFAILWITRASAIDSETRQPLNKAIAPEPPVTMLSARIDKDRNGDPAIITKVRTNQPIFAWEFSCDAFDKDGHIVQNNPGAIGFGSSRAIEGKEICTDAFCLQRNHRQGPPQRKFDITSIVVIKFRLKTVTLADKSLWTPPADHPITFEARLKAEEKPGKTDEKAEKNSNGGK